MRLFFYNRANDKRIYLGSSMKNIHKLSGIIAAAALVVTTACVSATSIFPLKFYS